MGNGQNIVSNFLIAAEKYPEHTAIVYPEQRISYVTLKSEVERAAAYFYRKGIRSGDRVLVFVPMSIDLYVDVLALFYIGATAVFLDEWVSRERLAICCEIAQCKGFIAPLKLRLLGYTSKAIRKIPVWLKPTGREVEKTNLLYAASATDTALVTFTTGSTGTPKAARRTHGFLQAQFDALIDKIQPSPNDIDLVALPIVLLLNLGAGATSVIPAHFKASRPDKMPVEKIVDAMRTEKVNRMEASPFFIRRIAQFCIDTNTRLPELKKVFTGGAPVFPSEAALYVKAFTSAKPEIVYGSTEAEPVSAIYATELVAKYNNTSKGLCVGKPYQGTHVRIIPISDVPITFDSDASMQQQVLQCGQAGEIVVSGKHVLQEYVNNPEALKRNKVFIGDVCWHRTGDSGWLDENGNLFLTGRCGGLIEYRGEYLSPFIYEDFLRSKCSVAMGTVLHLNGKIVVVAEGKDGQAERIKETLKDAGMVADEVRILTKIPRDPRHHSKIEYGKLAELVR